MATIDTKFVVNAYGQSAGGVAPHFRLLVDGVDAGQASVSATSPTAYTFTKAVEAGVAHKVQVYYDNDATVNGADRNLMVKSIQVGGNTLLPTQATYDRYALDGQDVVAGQEGMWWEGALNFATPASYYPAPTTTTPTTPTTSGASTIVVNASGTAAGGVNAHFNLLVDGVKVGEGTAATTAKDFSFTTNAATGVGHKVQVQYDNDTAGRDLYVNKITINGHAHAPTESIVTYDKGALDGKDVVAGQVGMWWNGTLVVNAPASDFKSGTTTPPAPTPTTPSLSVTDVSVAEPKATTGGSGIAPGFLHTEGGQIVDSSGQNIKLTGVNWFGSEGYAFAPQGLWMDSYQSHMDKMKGLGFNVIRLPYSDAMLDAGRKPTGIDYAKNPDLVGKTSLEVFDKIIDYAGKIGMKIILDHHRSGDGASANENGLWYTSQYPESKMIENWKMLATRYAGKDAVIGADLHNEPHNPTTWGDGGANDWARAAERIGNAIQTVNKDWLLIVEGNEVYNNQWYWWGGNLLGQKNYDVKFNADPSKLVYSVHDYGPSLHMMDWFKTADFPNNMPAKWTEMWGRLIQNDQHPVLVGEYGSRMETAIDQKWMPKLVQYMNGDWDGNGATNLAAGDQGASWTYWAWSPGSGDTGGIMNDSWQVDYNKYDAIKAGLFKGTAATPGSTDAVFTVKLSAASTTAVKVNYATVDGTAKAGSDYTAANGTLTFNPGETTKTVSVKVLGDSVTEGVETFSLKLSAPSSATIADDTGVGSIAQNATAAAAQSDVYTHLVSQTVEQAPATTEAATQMAAQMATLGSVHDTTLFDMHTTMEHLEAGY